MQLDTRGTKIGPFTVAAGYVRLRSTTDLLDMSDNLPQIYQELSMSPRVVHFGKHEVMWHCR